jgi:hypothetical protein
MKLKAKRQAVGVRLTDEDGEFMEFWSVADAARFLEVTRQAVLQAIRLNGKCRGCRVEKTVEKKV